MGIRRRLRGGGGGRIGGVWLSHNQPIMRKYRENQYQISTKNFQLRVLIRLVCVVLAMRITYD